MRAVVLVFATCFSLFCFADAHRSEADAARDATSKPDEILEFMGVKPGWTVLDVFGGGGYYAEVLSHRVGETGKVYLHNNETYMGFAEGLDERLADNRLPNVALHVREIDALDLAEASIDMAILVLTYHDAYYVQEGWTLKPDPLFEALRHVIRPGGVLAIIDHHAKPGSGIQHASDLHRIDAEFARSDIEGRGFKFDAASNLLENPDDDLSKSVFDPEVRRQTSRFVYRFVRI